MYFVYILTNVNNNKKYVGVTNNFERRFKDHMRSPYDIGKALRKWGKESFKIELLPFEDKELAYEFEGLAIGLEEANSPDYYNMMPGGVVNNFEGDHNPMRRQEVKDNHPSLFTTENNPMSNPESKQKMIESQKRKSVLVGETIYPGVREAARQLGMSRQQLIYRLKSKNYPDHQYWNH